MLLRGQAGGPLMWTGSPAPRSRMCWARGHRGCLSGLVLWHTHSGQSSAREARWEPAGAGEAELGLALSSLGGLRFAERRHLSSHQVAPLGVTHASQAPCWAPPPRAAPALCPLLLGVSSVWPPGLWDVTTRRPDPDGWEEEECVCLSGGRGVRWRGNRRGPKAGLSLAEKVDAVCGKRQPPEYLHVLLGDTLVIVFRRKRLLYVTSPRNLLWFTVGLCVPLRYPPSSVLTWASKALNRANRSYRRGKEIPCGVPGWRSRLRIWRCHCCGKGLIPGLGTFAYYGCSQKNIYI